MPVVFGDLKEDGWLRIDAVNYKADEAENGYSVKNQKIPEYPKGGFGVGWELKYNPKLNEFRFDEIEIPYTEAEAMVLVSKAIQELAQVIKEK